MFKTSDNTHWWHHVYGTIYYLIPCPPLRTMCDCLTFMMSRESCDRIFFIFRLPWFACVFDCLCDWLCTVCVGWLSGWPTRFVCTGIGMLFLIDVVFFSRDVVRIARGECSQPVVVVFRRPGLKNISRWSCFLYFLCHGIWCVWFRKGEGNWRCDSDWVTVVLTDSCCSAHLCLLCVCRNSPLYTIHKPFPFPSHGWNSY